MTNNIVQICTIEDVREEFRRRGMSISDWARRHGVSAQLTYRILAGRTIGQRGQSHEICVLLGLKPGVIGAGSDLRFFHAQGSVQDPAQGTGAAQPIPPF